MHPILASLTIFLLHLSLSRSAPTDSASTMSAAPAEANAHLISMSYSGSGCPQGSASNAYDSSLNTNRFFFPGISAKIGPNVPQDQKTENCEVQLSIATAAGWRFAVKGKNDDSTVLKTRVDLNGDATGSLLSTFYIAGADSATVRYDYTGPRSGDLAVSDPAPGPAYPRSSCGGGILVVNHRVALSGGSSAAGSMELYGDAGGRPNSNFIPWGALAWERC
ncbi:hypothetical protein HYALB_00013751 [Hymenoscyphus albidus]|uniref:Secreted protein n=1 Tax=Hymenoscyphus albidus TaxID=595503 RepID=A0A9N9M029_9HELO|nr:hypothetical protein HYALB_00013751 [Hymenoscyphus albidus]